MLIHNEAASARDTRVISPVALLVGIASSPLRISFDGSIKAFAFGG